MKNVQKAVIILMIAVMLCGMMGCQNYYYWELGQDVSQIVEISIVYITEEYGKYEVLKVIDKEDWELFLEELLDLPFTSIVVSSVKSQKDLNWPYECVQIKFADGAYDLIPPFAPAHWVYDEKGVLYEDTTHSTLGGYEGLEVLIIKWLNK